MTLLYHPDVDQLCKDNLLEFFEFLHSHNSKFKNYAYQIIREFSEKHREMFLSSNLVHFMNELARERRDEMFGDLN